MRATWNGAVVAESDETIVVEGNHYFPRESVNPEFLTDSSTRSVCPWKGVARYQTVTVAGVSAPDGAWHYPKPWPLARKLRGRVAFWHGIIVEPAPRAAPRDPAPGRHG
jgi:uncharacterized protein (DUF427 family)